MESTNLWAGLTKTALPGNELWRILALFACILVSLVVAKVLAMAFRRSADRFESRRKVTRAAVFGALSRAITFVLFSVGLQQGLKFLHLGEKVADLGDTVASVLLTVSIGWLLYCLVDVVDAWLRKTAARTPSKMDDMLGPLVRKSLRVTISVLLLVQVATLLSDKPITSILAGLGVGGLAIALAAQETIKNFFGSLVILADKPFELGDRIVVDGHDGPVVEVGFRSTKVRTLEGHLVTIPNGELANKTIQNIGQRPYIRRLLNIGITYDTPPEKVLRAKEIVLELLENHEGMHADFPPRVYFNDFNSSSLNLIALYWYHPPDYWAFMAFGERFNQNLLKRFNEEGIDFAFPTQTVYLAGDPERPLALGRGEG